MTIHTMEQEESTLLGAAILGSMAAGFYGTVEDACRCVRIMNSYLPDCVNAGVHEKGYEKYKKLYQCLKDITLAKPSCGPKSRLLILL